jgi:quercetin dioxygenase-like cupin family protein
MEATKKLTKVVFSNQGTAFNILGHMVTVKLHNWDGNGNYVFELISPPGSGIPPHVHKNEDEVIYILEGELEVMIGGEVIKGKSGDCLNLVRNVPHGYINKGTIDTKTLWYISPGRGFEEFFNELSQFPPGPPDIEKLNSLCEKYGMRNL